MGKSRTPSCLEGFVRPCVCVCASFAAERARGRRPDRSRTCEDAEDAARLRLNYSVLLSAMRRHAEAAEQLEAAIATLREEERCLEAGARSRAGGVSGSGSGAVG